MLLTVDQIREILVVKHNCTFRDFMGHVQILRNHFNLENTREEELLYLLEQVDKEGEFKLIQVSSYPHINHYISKLSSVTRWQPR